MAKWDNMLSILWMLKSRKKLTAAQIADQLEISVRTVYRYIDALSASGVPIVADSGHDGGFYVLETFKETPLFFRSVELKAIVDASKFAKGVGYPYTDELEHALEKIEHSLNEEQMLDLQRLTSGFSVISSASHPGIVPMLRQLEQAILDGQTLLIAYRKENSDSAKERSIDPYGLTLRRNEWYLIAFCHQSSEIRTFRVDRIESVFRTEAFFITPENFSTEDYFREQSHKEREAEGPMVLIRIEGDTRSLDAICSHWHMHHYLPERTDAEARFLIDIPTIDKYLPRYLLTFGTSIRVLEPIALKNQIKAMAGQIAELYADDEN
ncbi:helix-turn-helix transcriptional regulator [Paenibacillus favisporus]|uniref:helix-turn-helix transcriptional regulator n=1 Tax=Paenibacillus favisporus TaxID=221028 RepID=UPI0013D8053A|nr:YafY family protein [Paenibacillus favisporus]